MAKVCPITKTIVLYADCLDCDWKDECKKPRQKSNDKSDVVACVMCGTTVPEGRQVCPICEDKASQKPIKQDFSKQCNMNDDDERNNCWSCTYFCFPIGCMFGEE